jgi:formate hydrogenlyase subunit 4
MDKLAAGIHVLSALALAPLLLGIINRVKARFAGRRGAPLLQTYYDLRKLLRKGAVYSRTTTWAFVAGPIVGVASAAAALTLVPLGSIPGLAAFSGDLLLFAYLLGLMRFFTVLAALDTGSAFEGMGASREVFFSALAEPALLLGLAALAVQSHDLSLSVLYAAVSWDAMAAGAGPALLLVAAALLVVFLAENARIPVDDPNTHLELTMIHEVMVLDHGGPDFALIQYAAALKMWVLGALVVGILVPVRSGLWIVDFAAGLAGMAALAVVTGVIESTIARLRLVRVPQFLVAASVLSILALILVMR